MILGSLQAVLASIDILLSAAQQFMGKALTDAGRSGQRCGGSTIQLPAGTCLLHTDGRPEMLVQVLKSLRYMPHLDTQIRISI